MLHADELKIHENTRKKKENAPYSIPYFQNKYCEHFGECVSTLLCAWLCMYAFLCELETVIQVVSACDKPALFMDRVPHQYMEMQEPLGNRRRLLNHPLSPKIFYACGCFIIDNYLIILCFLYSLYIFCKYTLSPYPRFVLNLENPVNYGLPISDMLGSCMWRSYFKQHLPVKIRQSTISFFFFFLVDFSGSKSVCVWNTGERSREDKVREWKYEWEPCGAILPLCQLCLCLSTSVTWWDSGQTTED